MPTDGSDPILNYRAIRHELREYKASLAERPEVLVVSKAELPGGKRSRRLLAAEVGRDVLLISAVTGQGLNLLIQALAQHLLPSHDD